MYKLTHVVLPTIFDLRTTILQILIRQSIKKFILTMKNELADVLIHFSYFVVLFILSIFEGITVTSINICLRNGN